MDVCLHLSTLGFKLNHVSERVPWGVSLHMVSSLNEFSRYRISAAININQSQSVNWFTSPGHNDRPFVDDILRCIFLTEKVCIVMKMSLKFDPEGPIANGQALVKKMAWRLFGAKPLNERMLTWFTDAYMRH